MTIPADEIPTANPYLLPPLTVDDLEICRAFGIPRLLMCAVRHPQWSSRYTSGAYYAVRIRDEQAAFAAFGAELAPDHLSVVLFGVAEEQHCAIEARIDNILSVAMVGIDYCGTGQPPVGKVVVAGELSTEDMASLMTRMRGVAGLAR